MRLISQGMQICIALKEISALLGQCPGANKFCGDISSKIQWLSILQMCTPKYKTLEQHKNKTFSNKVLGSNRRSKY